jgi:hypothetical protein
MADEFVEILEFSRAQRAHHWLHRLVPDFGKQHFVNVVARVLALEFTLSGDGETAGLIVLPLGVEKSGHIDTDTFGQLFQAVVRESDQATLGF